MWDNFVFNFYYRHGGNGGSGDYGDYSRHDNHRSYGNNYGPEDSKRSSSRDRDGYSSRWEVVAGFKAKRMCVPLCVVPSQRICL